MYLSNTENTINENFNINVNEQNQTKCNTDKSKTVFLFKGDFKFNILRISVTLKHV